MADKYNKKKLAQSAAIARLYYEEDLGQSEIAHQVGLSRPTVSRLLKLARETGIVEIKISNPLINSNRLSEQLSKKFNCKISVVPSNFNGELTALKGVGVYTAQYLQQLIKPHDIVCLDWGRTIHMVTSSLEKQVVPDVQVVQLQGGVNINNEETYADESVSEFAAALGATAHFLPLPPFFDNKTTKEIVEKDHFINQALQLGRAANIAVYSVGAVRKDLLLFQLGYFNKSQKKQLQEKAVGEVISHFIDSNGDIVSRELDERTVGIGLKDLKSKDHSILVASGILKTPVVYAAIKAGYPNELILDQAIGQELLTYQ
ncbi:RNA polymerase subunit sigma-70 [Lactobacillus sp. ESL0731]|uniref:sugar-binding transcriptional regulator n=1 Tax=unclassified Lactobacillus TaxID=2620435 RepID=UPI0023F71C33|nr:MULTISPECIES: sugar-binding domain-containing protein [unclassified Lactobacillus]WEV51284.1 RNA polymerase subunit sigma-70 [Lactobacillus sp. ESL0700]WEV62414.1 RNA polymerase subunit sigma-70 [Lactobacillus sp. ESL0731]